MESRVDPATSVRRRLVSTRSISFEKTEVGSKKLLIYATSQHAGISTWFATITFHLRIVAKSKSTRGYKKKKTNIDF